MMDKVPFVHNGRDPKQKRTLDEEKEEKTPLGWSSGALRQQETDIWRRGEKRMMEENLDKPDYF